MMPPTPPRPHVLLATDAFPPVCGGSGWSTFELAKGLRRRGHDVLVVQPRPGQPTGRRRREYEGVPVIEIGSPAPPVPFVRNYFKNERLHVSLARHLEALAREHGSEILHAQHSLTAPAATRTRPTLGLPVVCTVRDYWPVCYWANLIRDPDEEGLCPACTPAAMATCLRPRAGPAWPLALSMVPYMRANLARKRAALAAADAVVAVSSAIASDLRQRAPELARTRMEVIPNPVDVAGIEAQARARARPLVEPYAIYVGKLEVNKGAQHLVPAVTGARLPWRLVVVGDGSLRARIERDAAAAGRQVDILGWRTREEVIAWLAHAELLVFPSHGPESLSRVLLEASAVGIAIAAMDTGGTRDIVVPGRTGLVSSSVDGLSRDLAKLAADAGLRTQLGTAARAHVAEHFDAAAVVARVTALYDDLITSHGASGA